MILLDTNVLSELMKDPAVRDRRVATWLRSQHQLPATTAVCAAELLQGAHRLPDGRRRDALLSATAEMLAGLADVAPFDERCAGAYALVVASRRRMGRPIDPLDAQIAGIALVRGAALATRNTRDFEGLGIALIDPWE